MPRKIFIFECDNVTQIECINKELFGSNLVWPLKVNEEDLCFLYNYETNLIFGVWKALSKGKKDIDPNAWLGKFRYQVKVKKCSNEYIEMPKNLLFKYVVNPNGRVMNEIYGDRAEDFYQYIAKTYYDKIEFGKEVNQDEKDFRDKYPAEWICSDRHPVRSKNEMIIDEWLSKNHIQHDYEKLIPIPEGISPDFTVYDKQGRPVYIEYWGIVDDPKYNERMKKKYDIYSKYSFPLIGMTPENLKKLDFYLFAELRKKGVFF